ncbi:MAG: DUF2157 domain-containing protein [Nitrospirae bacterium]|nr:DUF2157 domain-containing protein [Nitrospirota bacterium]
MLSIIIFIAFIILAALLFRSTGGKSFQSRLKNHLRYCADEGIISTEQEIKIFDKLLEKKHGLRIKGTAWIAILAGLFISAGVCLIIAHNWDKIGPVVRVAAFILILLISGELAIRFQNRSRALSIPLELFWFFLPLIGIGLYAQTFQLSGHPIRPFLVWLSFTLPIALASPNRIIAPLHMATLIAVLFYGNYASGDDLSILTSHGSEVPVSIWAWLLSLVILIIAAIESHLRLPSGHRRHMIGILIIWIVLLLVNHTYIRVEHAGWLMLAFAAGSSSWLLLHLYLKSSETEKQVAQLSWIVSIYAMTFFWHMKGPITGDYSIIGVIIILLFTIASAAMILLLPEGALSKERKWQWFGQGMLLASIATPMLLLTDGPLEVIKGAAIIANFLLAMTGIAFMWHGSLYGRISQINIGVIIVLLLLITRFIDVFGTLLQGGFGFIISGILLALLAYSLERGRKHLIGMTKAGEME